MRKSYKKIVGICTNCKKKWLLPYVPSHSEFVCDCGNRFFRIKILKDKEK